MLLLALAFAAAAFVTAAATPLVCAGARAAGIVAAPVRDRWHRTSTPLLGGIGIYLGFIAGILILLRVRAVEGEFATLLEAHSGAIGVVASASLMFVVGLLDDQFRFRPATKLVFQILAAAVAISFGVLYSLTPWVSINVVLTIVWFLTLTNALNLLDNMDGVAAGVAAIAAVFLAASFASHEQYLLAGVCLALAGATAGFLPYNFHPASIFMGDSGSLFLGALLAGLGALYPTLAPGSIISVLSVPTFIVIIPLLDTALVTVMRTLAGRPISVGGRDHTSHRLVAMGLSERQVALVLYAVAVAGGMLALVLPMTVVAIPAGVVFLIALGVLAAYLGKLQPYSPEQVASSTRLTVFVSDILYKRRILEAFLDLLIFVVAYAGAYLLRYDGQVPPSQVEVFERTLALAVAAKSVAFAVTGVYRGIWQHVAIEDLHRFVRAAVLGELLTIAAVVVFFREAEFARSIFAIDALLTLFFVSVTRTSFRSLDSVRRRFVRSGTPALVYGAGHGGGLLVREARGNPSMDLRPVAFIDDDPLKRGKLVHGLPVLGSGEQLAQVLARMAPAKVVVSTRKIDPHRLETLRCACGAAGIEVLQFDITLRGLEDVSAIEGEGGLRLNTGRP